MTWSASDYKGNTYAPFRHLEGAKDSIPLGLMAYLPTHMGASIVLFLHLGLRRYISCYA